MEQAIIVNDQDEIIGYKNRKDISDSDIYRVSCLLITNSGWKVLLAQRSFKKKLGPGLWSFSVAWWVQKWQSYNDNIVKETEEEIGISDVKMTKVFKKRMNIIWLNFFCQFYTAILDVDTDYFTICEEEVEALRWFSIEEIKKGEFEWNAFSENLTRNIDDFVVL